MEDQRDHLAGLLALRERVVPFVWVEHERRRRVLRDGAQVFKRDRLARAGRSDQEDVRVALQCLVNARDYLRCPRSWRWAAARGGHKQTRLSVGAKILDDLEQR